MGFSIYLSYLTRNFQIFQVTKKKKNLKNKNSLKCLVMQEEIVHSYVQSYSHHPLLVLLHTSGATLEQ